MKTLYLMVGAPGSGKSTYCREHLNDKTAWVSRDVIRFELLKEGEDYFSHETQVWKQFVKEIQEAIDDPGIEIIYADATHINEVSRNRLLRSLIIDRNKCNLGAIEFLTDYITCSNFNKKRTGRAVVPDRTVMDMSHRKTSPANDKAYHYDEIIKIDNSEVDYTLEILDNLTGGKHYECKTEDLGYL